MGLRLSTLTMIFSPGTARVCGRFCRLSSSRTRVRIYDLALSIYMYVNLGPAGAENCAAQQSTATSHIALQF